jgi:GDP-4-dehydro-6-deoxy-D-mannose reductase
MKILIVGAAGFVGSHLIEHFLLKGWEIETTCLEGEKVSHGVPAHILDIRNQGDIEKVLEKSRPEAIVHLAAQSSVGLSWKKPALTAEINVLGSINLLEAIRVQAKDTRVLLVGSSEEYGAVSEESNPISETQDLNPSNIYAMTKVAQDITGRLYAQAYDIDIMCTRSFNHIGPGQAPGFVVSDFCSQIAKIKIGEQEPIIKVGNLSARRDFTDVRDVVRAYAFLLEKGQGGEIYNVGSGHAVAVQDILDKLISLSGIDIEVQIDSSRFRPIDVPVIEADISKLQEATGWKPEIPIETTLKDVLNG